MVSVLPKTVAYAPVGILGGNVGVVADAPSVISELVHLAAHLAGFFYSEYGGGLRNPLRV